MTKFEFWQEVYLTSLRRLNAYRVGDEEKLGRHSARIADHAVTHFCEAADQLATHDEMDELNDEEVVEDELEGEEDQKREPPHVLSPSGIVPAQRG